MVQTVPYGSLCQAQRASAIMARRSKAPPSLVEQAYDSMVKELGPKSKLALAGVRVGMQYLKRSDYGAGRYEQADRYTVMALVSEAMPEVVVLRHDLTGGTFLCTLDESSSLDDTGAIGSQIIDTNGVKYLCK
jgi:hypothetical protein